jgi:rhamnose transport system permease protein
VKHEAILAVVLGLVLAVAAVLDPIFVRPATQWELAGSLWETALIAVPMALIILAGGIDLSPGSTAGLCSVLLLLGFGPLPLPLACAAVLVAGALLGAINGLATTRLRAHPLIVTLATFSAYRGLAEGLSLGRSQGTWPASFTALAWVTPALAILSFALGALLLAKTAFGKTVRALGYNETAVRFNRLPIDRTKVLLYAWCGLAAATAALTFAMRRHTAKADVGLGIELEAITAVVLGGVRIQGGRGSLLGVALGLLLVHEVRQFVSWRWGQSEAVLIATGVLLIVSVALARPSS